MTSDLDRLSECIDYEVTMLPLLTNADLRRRKDLWRRDYE